MKQQKLVGTHLKAPLVATLVISALVIISGCNQNPGATNKQAKIERLGNLEFYRGKDAALQEARKRNTPVFVDFYANWCVNCKLFNKLAIRKGPLNDALKKVVLLKIYDTDPVFAEFRGDPRFKELKVGLPLFAILHPNGALRWKTTDYKDSIGMVRNLKIDK